MMSGRRRDLQVRSESADQRGPAVEHDQRAVAVRVQRHLIGERRPLPAARQPPQRHGGRIEFAGERIDKRGDAAEKLRLADIGITRDAQAAP